MRRTWEEFRATGLLWLMNRSLHLFGWSIAMDIEEDGTIADCYPVRCTYRGFSREDEEEGFEKVSRYLAVKSEQLLKEAKR